MWRAMEPIVRTGTERGREELNETRRRLGLAPLDHVHGGISRELALVGTFPQLEYPRHSSWPWVRVTGPLMYERPADDVDLPPGDDPLVLIAPSTSQDRDQRMLRAALAALADEPVRVIAATNRRGEPVSGLDVPANARVVDWLSYGRTMPECSAVVCHAGHGTVVRSLASGVPLVACPAAGDMGENAARVAWAGVGVSLPRRLVTARGIRLAVRRVLGEPRYSDRARELAEWASRNDGAARAADVLEEKLRGWDSNPQPTVNSRSLCLLSYPGPPNGVREGWPSRVPKIKRSRPAPPQPPRGSCRTAACTSPPPPAPRQVIESIPPRRSRTASSRDRCDGTGAHRCTASSRIADTRRPPR